MHATTVSQVVVPSGDTISLKTFIFVCSNLGVSFKTEFNHMTRLNTTCHPILRELQTTNNLLNKNAVTTFVNCLVIMTTQKVALSHVQNIHVTTE